jgi:catechol 2,3-dioxygenase-like lactoylglutathione lyase family enzyme
MNERDGWPDRLPVSRTRVARAVFDLEKTRRFYGDGIGLPEIGSFSDHAGYSGVFYGLPGAAHQLEFTEDESQSVGTPAHDDLLVLYIEDDAAIDQLVERLAALGYPTVAPQNPYWHTVEDSLTIRDPDGWHVVLVKPRR